MSLATDLDLFARASLSIVFEATPFLLLGSLASGLVETYVPRERLERLFPKGRLTAPLAGLGLGVIIPCCECGVVYLVRRLLAKGVPPGAALAFMLAGPVVNPVSILATVVAFRGDLAMAAWRCLVVAAAALAVGVWAGGRQAETLIKPLSGREPACGCGHDHAPAHGQGAGGSPFGSLVDAVPVSALRPNQRQRLVSALGHATADFCDMAKVLVVGAMVAAAFKAFMPGGVITAMEESLPLSVLGMMGLAVALSLCSQADAFVAASFSGFPDAARLAFLALGPMLDCKLVLMWRQVFTRRLVWVLVLVPAAVVLVACLGLGLVLPGGPS